MEWTQPRLGTSSSHFLEEASRRDLAYLHVVDMGEDCPGTLTYVRGAYDGLVITNNMLKPDAAAALIETGEADAVSFGRAFIANPDYPTRIQTGTALAKPDYSLLYTGEERGYCDYPAAE